MRFSAQSSRHFRWIRPALFGLADCFNSTPLGSLRSTTKQSRKPRTLRPGDSAGIARANSGAMSTNRIFQLNRHTTAKILPYSQTSQSIRSSPGTYIFDNKHYVVVGLGAEYSGFRPRSLRHYFGVSFNNLLVGGVLS